MSAPVGSVRWEMLADLLHAHGFEAKVDERAYTQAVRGRVQHGVTRSITLRTRGGWLVEVSDQWSRADRWLGWQVHLIRPDSITHDEAGRLRSRAEVLAVVGSAFALGMTQ